MRSTMIPLGPVVARSRVRAARAAVWSYLVDSGRRSEWWPGLQLEPGVGGAVAVRSAAEEGGEASPARETEGAVDVWVEGHAFGFTWRESGEERTTAVLLTLRSQGHETGVTVTETGFDALAAPAERAAVSQQEWGRLLAELAGAVEAAAEAASDGALEVAPLEIEGEVDAELVEVEAVEIEVEAEPQVGDRLELDTGSVPVVEAQDARDAEVGDTAEAGDTIEVERLAVPGEPRDSDDPEEPDFDSIIRGA
ncbi:SRPBCC domain-containing protein [Leucobacter sp. wl10]|uniref:SRPBCC domain-containing protein n=1 Tax=Leucobacter sp. wl10 TaxID=2304677 RepID=UPI0013C3380E|nr:SRPBCC domain-containing protein [Leucobacter sp. wl10]